MIFKQFDDVCIPIPRTLTDCIVLIKSDMYRYCGYSSKSKIWREVLINPSFAFVFWFRLSSVQWIGYPVAKMIKTLIGRKRGLQISEHTPIGYGFYIAHAFGTIIKVLIYISTLENHRKAGVGKSSHQYFLFI